MTTIKVYKSDQISNFHLPIAASIMPEKELVNTKVKLERFPGKGGWTYAALPSVKRDKHSHFGWVRVKGFIDNYELKQYHLAPMKNGSLFLPVKAAIRKQIKKEAGDVVTIRLYADESKIEVPGEFMECLADEPEALKNFTQLSDTIKKHWIAYIEQVKSDERRIERMAEAVNRLAAGETEPG
jgi:hypothetical protein